MYYIKTFIVLPHITPFDLEEEVNTGESIQLNCHVSKGDQPLKISWNFNREALSAHMGISITQLGDRSSVLTIANAMAAHSGNYMCTATNAAGSTSHTATVHINGTEMSCFAYLFAFGTSVWIIFKAFHRNNLTHSFFNLSWTCYIKLILKYILSLYS